MSRRSTGLLELELDHLGSKVVDADAALSKTVKRFLTDMDADRSSFFHLPRDFRWQPEKLSSISYEPGETFLHLGIGGSSLGTEAIIKALAPSKASKFHFLDHVDSDALFPILAQTDPKHCFVYVVSKSGTTLETMSVFSVVYRWMEEKLGQKEARRRLAFCTDPTKGFLRELSQRWQVPAYDVPPNLGGRFSALSWVGMLPAACAGLRADEFLEGAKAERQNFLESWKRDEVPAVAILANALVKLYREQKNVTVLMPYSSLLRTFSGWFVQLWAESLGKNGLGMTPVAASGPTDQHSILQLLRDGPNDKMVGFIEVKNFEHTLRVGELEAGQIFPAMADFTGKTLGQILAIELEATRQVMTNNKRPHFTISTSRLNERTLGALFFFFETLTAMSGYLLNVDPFDQPGVEEGKIIAKRLFMN